MENAIPALIVGAVILVASALTAHGSLQSYDKLGQSLKAMESRLGERSQTALSIEAAALDGQRDTLTFNLQNRGQTRLATFERVDLIVDYVSDTGRVRRWLPFTTGSPTANCWTVTSISSDSFEPGLLNPGETAAIKVELSPPASANKEGRVIVASETGAVVSAMFSK